MIQDLYQKYLSESAVVVNKLTRTEQKICLKYQLIIAVENVGIDTKPADCIVVLLRSLILFQNQVQFVKVKYSNQYRQMASRQIPGSIQLPLYSLVSKVFWYKNIFDQI
ncbi:Hypothetical_protein [Hexamita inflata]|uniref:Hypothetical_protein n=1 Tax=Hexamita inflata TaxID=28002 RepID=A0AA86TYR3_9EUKA|nr:Hypothetical protein HINF_LOCUS21106 [Hexamita inflata]